MYLCLYHTQVFYYSFDHVSYHVYAYNSIILKYCSLFDHVHVLSYLCLYYTQVFYFLFDHVYAVCRLAQAIYSLTHLCNAVLGQAMRCVAIRPSWRTHALMPCDLLTRGRMIRSLHTLGPYRYTLDLLRLDSNRSPFPDAVELHTDPPSISRFIQNCTVKNNVLGQHISSVLHLQGKIYSPRVLAQHTFKTR